MDLYSSQLWQACRCTQALCLLQMRRHFIILIFQSSHLILSYKKLTCQRIQHSLMCYQRDCNLKLLLNTTQTGALTNEFHTLFVGMWAPSELTLIKMFYNPHLHFDYSQMKCKVLLLFLVMYFQINLSKKYLKKKRYFH